MEHYHDRWVRIKLPIKKTGEDKFGYWYGRRSIRDSHYWENPVTNLNECALCGMVSTPKRVHERNDCWNWNVEEKDYETESKGMLCMGCWNKVRPIVKAKREAQEIKTLTGKLYREALKWQKLQTQAS